MGCHFEQTVINRVGGGGQSVRIWNQYQSRDTQAVSAMFSAFLSAEVSTMKCVRLKAFYRPFIMQKQLHHVKENAAPLLHRT